MELISLNKQWALFRYRDQQACEHSLELLKSILQIRSHSDLISFLYSAPLTARYMLHPSSLFNGDCYFPQRGSDNKAALKLQGDLEASMKNFPHLQMLEKSSFEKIKKDNNLGLFYIPDLLEFKIMMEHFLRCAAISLGSKANQDVFITREAEDFFDRDPLEEEYDLRYRDLYVTYVPYSFINSDSHKFIASAAFEEGSSFMMEEDVDDFLCEHKENATLGNNDKTMIYFYFDSLHCGGKNADIGGLCVLHHKTVSKEEVYKNLSGRIIESILNYQYLGANQEQFLQVAQEENSCERYRYDSDKGYVEVSSSEEYSWIPYLFQEAESLVIAGKVSLCPMCSKIVFIKDARGRKKRSFCSNSCKTKASQERKARVHTLAQHGASLEEILAEMGEEYRSSIIRWYLEIEEQKSPKADEQD